MNARNAVIRQRHTRRPQHGAGALIVVLVLFFIMSLVAAYASRNMIFEQKTSANQYRSTQAFEAADAGIEWALAMLNSGRIDNSCTATTGTAGSFRQRYINIDPSNGNITPTTWNDSGTPRTFRPTCVRTATGWSCSCPDAGLPTLAAPGSAAPEPAFRIRLLATGAAGVVRIRSQGCTRLSETCLSVTETATGGDATAVVEAVVALKGAVTTPPAAALTVRGDVDAGATFSAINTDSATAGVTINAGGTALPVNPALLTSLPGTPGELSVVGGDPTLSPLTLTADRMFTSVFGMKSQTYREQPATIVRRCADAECAAADLASLAAGNPGRMLWLEGNADLDTAVDIGSPTAPVVIVVNGNLTSSAAPVRIYGAVYVVGTLDGTAAGSTWTTTGTGSGGLAVQGAAVAQGNIAGAATSPFQFQYEPTVLQRLRLASGSFVRVPGGWKDF